MASAGKIIVTGVRAAAAAVITTIFVNEKIAGLFKLSGPSMLPTIAEDGDVALVSRLPVAAKSLMVGDIVTVKDPEEPGGYLGKRIAGVPGSLVSIPSRSLMSPGTQTIRVPPGHVWLLGDNPSESRDSRKFGPVSQGLVVGRVVAIVWPPERARFIPSGAELAVKGSTSGAA